MAPRDVVDLLADEPPETLAAMLASVQSKLAHLTIEAQLIEAAQAKQSRRNRGGGGSSGSRLTKEQVFAVVDRANGPLSPVQVHEALTGQGLPGSLNSVRNHLARLVDQHGWLTRTKDGRFVSDPEPTVTVTLPDDFPAAATADDDIPF